MSPNQLSPDLTVYLTASHEPAVDRILAQHVLARVGNDPYFLGACLARAAERERLGVEALARRVGCSVAMLPRLALFQRPDPAGPRFSERVLRIADRTGADPAALADLLSAHCCLPR